MKCTYSFILLFFVCYISHAQLVLNNGIIINVANGSSNSASATIVLNTPPAVPITQLGTTTSQGIMLESEWNRIQYNLKTGTTAITVPYISNATGSWVPFPLTFRNVTAGVGANGAIRFSSKHAGTMGTGWDNLAYTPTQVGNMYGTSCGPGDNSANVVDRFWVIEPVYYTTRPAMTLDFTYIMGETDINGGGNTAGLASLLQPQRFDSLNPTGAICGWNGFPVAANEYGTNTPAGSITATSVGTLTGVTVTAANFFPDWTLANYLLPLPVEILNYAGLCENKNVTLKWTSAHETNSAFYTIEKSADGINYTQLTNVTSAGNSNQNITYTYIDVSPGENTTNYYRLSETDKNGNKKMFQAIPVTSCNASSTENGTIYSYGNEVNINLFSLSNQNITVIAYDVTGRLIYQNQLFASQGNNSLKLTTDLSQGVYLFELKTEKLSIIKRILIER
jgi:hypothetical protein